MTSLGSNERCLACQGGLKDMGEEQRSVPVQCTAASFSSVLLSIPSFLANQQMSGMHSSSLDETECRLAVNVDFVVLGANGELCGPLTIAAHQRCLTQNLQ